MSLSDLAAIGSLISGIAVLVSLIYLGVQTQQNSKHTKGLILQGRVARIVNQHIAIASSDLAAAWIVGNGGNATLEEIGRRQFFLQCLAYDLSWEDTVTQYEAGLLGKEQFDDFRAHVIVFLREPGLRSYFSKRPIPVDGPTKFQRFINELLSESLTSPVMNRTTVT
jgi:hypothetical protein